MTELAKEMEFFIFLLEHYAFYKQTTADKVLKKLDALNLTDFVYNMYERYHSEALENAFADTDILVAEKESASLEAKI